MQKTYSFFEAHEQTCLPEDGICKCNLAQRRKWDKIKIKKGLSFCLLWKLPANIAAAKICHQLWQGCTFVLRLVKSHFTYWELAWRSLWLLEEMKGGTLRFQWTAYTGIYRKGCRSATSDRLRRKCELAALGKHTARG